MLEKIKKEFDREIINVTFTKKESDIFLEIETNLKKLENIVDLSNRINEYLNSIDKNRKYFVNVFSSGTESEIFQDQLKIRIEKNIKIFLKNSEILEGILKEVGEEKIIIKYNHKGQYRNKIIEIKNINKMYNSAIIRKVKKWK